MIRDEAQQMFNKRFTFSAVNDFEIRCSKPFRNAPWKVSKLAELKDQLNATKGMLSTNDSEAWHIHTAHTNRAGFVFQEVRNCADPELFTQAWLKFYECASQFPIIFESSKQCDVFHSVHLCEAPGAFITSLNHYIKSQDLNFTLNWTGLTLNPYYEGNSMKAMISDDYFIHLTQSNWLFGPNDTGDLLDLKNAKSFAESLSTQNVHLVTADGSIDCSDNPEDQENTVARLKWCEAIVALSILGNGGSLVLKMFTMFESTTISLLYLLRKCFAELHTFKPCTSKEGNSEVYVIAIGFKKGALTDDFLRSLWSFIYQDEGNACSNPLFSQSEIPSSFIEDVIACAATFKGFQEEAILRNLSVYNSDACADQQVIALKKKVARLYLKRYRLKRIPVESFLCGEAKRRLEYQRRKFSFQKRNRTSDTIKAVLKSDYRSLILQFEFIQNYTQDSPLSWETDFDADWQFGVKIISGKSYGMICNSSFSEKLTFQVFCEILKRNETDGSENHGKLKAFLRQANQDLLRKRFIEVASSLDQCDSLDIRNVPILSRYSASTLWLISKCFRKVGLIVSEQPCIRLSGYEKRDEILEYLMTIDCSLLSFVEISQLKNSPFFDVLFSYNSLLLVGYLKSMLGISESSSPHHCEA